MTGANREPKFAEQLDDAIARMVVEAERGGADVLQSLLTDRTYRVGGVSTDLSRTLGASCDPIACQGDRTPSCCDGPRCILVTLQDDGTAVGACETDYRQEAYNISRVYDVDTAAVEPDGAPAGDMEAGVFHRNSAAFSDRWQEMDPADRAGILTHPAWLAAHGGNTENDASAVLRGHWIREHLFCESVAGLGLVQLNAQLPDTTEDLRARDRLESAFGSEGDARCSNGACHGLMNSLGLPFEMFNHAGFVRQTDHAMPPDGSATITNWPGRDSVTVNNAVELSTMLADDPHVRRCFLRHVFRYFMGRYERPQDSCTLDAMETAFEGGSLLSALEALYSSDQFLERNR